MTTATLGTCSGCGLGLTLPHRAPWHVGQQVVVMTQQELDDILRAPAPPREIPYPISDSAVWVSPIVTVLRPSEAGAARTPNSELRSPISDPPRP